MQARLFLRLLTSPSAKCGSHGRFEYCVDDIPGCVIGCHCHPGYYFDTDTKICEPNTKLTQNYRRNYVSEPSRVQILTQTDTEATEATPTAPNPVDAKIDEITKDADDLGDWLYNQFFKTIENQVINKTNGEEKLTRRSANPTFANKPFRRSRKLWKKSRRKKKRKPKKGNLKKKLLRITEDDSLFDSSSSETSDSSSDSSSSSSASGSVSEHDSDTNKDHGHKKLVILSKKPKPQLPSFIFLPNIDTPFYPPIGLPPPPPVPMYPIIPVPPIGPFAIDSLTNRVEIYLTLYRAAFFQFSYFPRTVGHPDISTQSRSLRFLRDNLWMDKKFDKNREQKVAQPKGDVSEGERRPPAQARTAARTGTSSLIYLSITLCVHQQKNNKTILYFSRQYDICINFEMTQKPIAIYQNTVTKFNY
ncbi:hypothetical protein K1T71_009726 [Dendrolimus kikuchii]|uniref:Uncharacterized protein n=1 Tax=Dendrolimus kikuchii TaxID=765133 RepID=A0ACC1CSL3_9NEOP|nr:hypothetical protein K1T71_009726 [Dendrolimus kikuchii]